MTMVDVLYIAGLGRSGSTLLASLLGSAQGLVSVGEMRSLSSAHFRPRQLCGCGEPFEDCPFWRAVDEEAFGTAGPPPVDRLRKLYLSSGRLRHVPRLLRLRRSAPARLRGIPYVDALGRLYAAVSAVSGARVVVDSSKEPAHGFVLRALPGIRVTVVHLVRDPRAVAFSWTKVKEKPEIHWEREHMPRFRPSRTALKWTGANALCEVLARRAEGSIRVRYEDLVSEPRPWLEQILKGLPVSGELDFLEGRTATLDAGHSVSGNPMRFGSSRVRIRRDESWRTAMGRWDRLLVSALTWPLLVGYGYEIWPYGREAESGGHGAGSGPRAGGGEG